MALHKEEIREMLEKIEQYEKKLHTDLFNLEQSLRYLDRIIANEPPHAYYYKKRACIKSRLFFLQSQNQLLDSALADIDTAISLDPDRGEYYLLRGDFIWHKFSAADPNESVYLDKVISEYRNCLSRNPTKAEAWLGLIVANMIYGEYDEAISYYGQCKPYMTDKSNKLVRAFLGCLAMILAGDRPDGEDMEILTDRTIILDQLNFYEARVYFFWTVIREKTGSKDKWREASDIMRQIIGHYRSWNLRGGLFEMIELYEEALNALEEAVRQDPGFYETWYRKGSLLKHLHRYEEALQDLDQALSLKKDDIFTWDKRGDVLNEMGRYPEALESYTKVVEIDPGNAGVWHKRGVLLDRLMRYEEAIYAFDQVVKVWPDHALAWNDKGHALLILKRYEEAISAFDQAINVLPGYADAWFNKGLSFLALNRDKEAISAFDQALLFDPRRNVVWRNKSVAFAKLGLYDEALRCLKKYIELECGDAALDEKGNALWEMGHYDEAVAAYEEALKSRNEEYDQEGWQLIRQMSRLLTVRR